MVQNTVAVLVDGGFFLKRHKRLFPKDRQTPADTAEAIWNLALDHIRPDTDRLYRIFYYDCPPLDRVVFNPISKQEIDLSASSVAVFRHQLFDELKKRRKVALRLGRLSDNMGWKLNPAFLKKCLKGQRRWEDVSANDLVYDTVQKGVDMRMGIDISSITLKRLVNKIILVTGDSDFVPAAKLARREGVDVVLDPMWAPINPELYEHIDGLKNKCPKPKDGRDATKMGHGHG